MGTCYKRYGKQGEWELPIKGMVSRVNGSCYQRDGKQGEWYLLSKIWQAGRVVLAI